MMRPIIVFSGAVCLLLFVWLGERASDWPAKRVALFGAYLILAVGLVSWFLAPPPGVR